MNQPYVTFLVGLMAGLLGIGAILASFGRWLLKTIVKEVIGEMSGNWMSAEAGKEHARRLEEVEKAQGMLVAHLLGQTGNKQ